VISAPPLCQHAGTDQGQGPGSGEDRGDEPNLQHATAGVLAQAPIRQERSLSGGTGQGRLVQTTEAINQGV
jgi:hypothetical protein